MKTSKVHLYFHGSRILIRLIACGAVLLGLASGGREVTRKEDLWSLRPVVRPPIPTPGSDSRNPIDAFIGEACRERGISPLGPAGKGVWLHRVTLDLTGILPTQAEQQAFLNDASIEAIDTVVMRLLGSEQHGVRYGRHWLDVLRYADVDEGMPAAPGIHLWRDWVITALNQDLPYDAFVRAQLCGNRAEARTVITATGHRMPVEPRPEDVFALGFLARGASTRADADQQLAIGAVDTLSSAFLGITVGCAKCHDHFFDPVKQADFYSMKALFDPLVLRPLELASAEQMFARGRAVAEYETRKQTLIEPMNKLIEPHRTRLYEERLNMLPKEAQAAIRKREKQRSKAEQRIADDYFPILRIDPPKIKEVMTQEDGHRYESYLKEINALQTPEPLPVFWTVEEDSKRLGETNYVLTTGDPTRPRLSQPVDPGFPFGPERRDLREGRREEFADWLTAPENPLFARVVVNRIWQWHFGSGLHASAIDFGTLGGIPRHPKLLDWLASEFVAHHYSMKWLHRLIVTSETYRRASSEATDTAASNHRLDPDNQCFWRYPLQRLEAEVLRDSMLQMAGRLDTSLGGRSVQGEKWEGGASRRATYLIRGYRSSGEVLPDFFKSFDVEDGRSPCLVRGQTVTAPQALFLMNSDFSEKLATLFAQRLRSESDNDLEQGVGLGYELTLGRPPSLAERRAAIDYLQGDPERMKGFAWLLFNLDEFLYVR